MSTPTKTNPQKNEPKQFNPFKAYTKIINFICFIYASRMDLIRFDHEEYKKYICSVLFTAEEINKSGRGCFFSRFTEKFTKDLYKFSKDHKPEERIIQNKSLKEQLFKAYSANFEVLYPIITNIILKYNNQFKEIFIHEGYYYTIDPSCNILILKDLLNNNYSSQEMNYHYNNLLSCFVYNFNNSKFHYVISKTSNPVSFKVPEDFTPPENNNLEVPINYLNLNEITPDDEPCSEEAYSGSVTFVSYQSEESDTKKNIKQ